MNVLFQRVKFQNEKTRFFTGFSLKKVNILDRIIPGEWLLPGKHQRMRRNRCKRLDQFCRYHPLR